ncbi:MAG: ribonuclease P protein component [Gemmatimonadota bacterium]
MSVNGAERFPRRARIRRDLQIRSLVRRGKRRQCGPFDLYVAGSAGGRPRVGLVVPTFGRSKAERNRLKRVLRELLRREWLAAAWRVPLCVDLLLRARPAAYEASFAELRAALLACMPRDHPSGDGS